MPNPSILRILGMSPKEWGMLPNDDDSRERLLERAIIMFDSPWERLKNAFRPKYKRVSRLEIEREKIVLKARLENNLTRTGFQDAMVQQGTFFGDAVKDLRFIAKGHNDRLAAIETRLAAIEKEAQLVRK